MKIILNQNVESLGSVGEVIQVRDGYARNYLIPKGLATLATDSNVRIIEKTRSKEIAREKERKAVAETLAKKIGEATVVIEMNAGDDEKLFGSVQAADVQEALGLQGITVDRKDVLVKQPIRKTGNHTVEIRCAVNLKAVCRVQVTKKKG